MKLLRLEVNRILMITIFAIAISLTTGVFVYAGSFDDENNKTYSNDTAGVFSPGYLNAAKYKTESIVNQATPKTGLMANIVNMALGKTANNIKEDAVVIKFNLPELKKKASASTSGKAQAATNVSTEDLSKYNVKIGTGTDQVYDGSRLISEVINGKRNIYAGFDNAGTATIQEAMALANAGDKVIVKAGAYEFYNNNDQLWSGGVEFQKSGVSLYGGYGEDGIFNPTANQSIIKSNGTFTASGGTDIDIIGFTFQSVDVNDANWSGRTALFSITSSIGGNISNNKFVDTALELGVSSSTTVQNNAFSGYWSQMSVIRGTNNTIKYNTFSGYYGLNFGYGAQALVEHNSFSSGDGSCDVSVGGDVTVFPEITTVTLKNNNFNGSSPIILGGDSNVTSSGDYYANGVAPSSGLTILNASAKPNSTSSTTTQASPLALASEPLTIDTDARFGDTGSDSYKFATGDLGGASPLGTVLKNLLANNGNLGGAGGLNNMMPDKVSANPMAASALSLPLSINPNQRVQDMEAAMKLANILKNPTEDQKLILDAVQALIKDMDNTAVAQNNKELQAEADKLMDMAASYLLNQALPDLIKAGDMAGVKNIFQDLNASKSKIMLEYQTATTPYYSEVKKMLQENAEGLQAKGMLSKTITQEQLEKLPPKEISRILDMIRKDPNRTFGEDYILQQESKLNKKYLEPNKKILEEQMKAMLKEFTKRLSAVLEVKEK